MTSSSAELGEVLARASELAGVRCIDVPTFLAALEISPEAMEILQRCGVTAASLRAAIALSGGAGLSPEQEGDEPFDPFMRACVDAAGISAVSSDRKGARSSDVLCALLQVQPRPDALSELERLGMSLLRLRRVTAHGMADYPPPQAPASELCAVRLHNDPFTTREFVIEVLTGTFGLGDALAKRLMLRTHEQQGASFGPVHVKRAIECVDAAQRHAAEQQFPLRITLEDAATAEESVDANEVGPPTPPEREDPALAWERRAGDAADRARSGTLVALVIIAVLALAFVLSR